ncbi:MAG TPA: hypothetical protein VGX92_09010 [Pyrinomonadaceae bacterium]|nr:hypothetical protein [Pyrinomonadaceae bacterium]
MKSITLLAYAALVLALPSVQRRNPDYGLPAGARIIEVRPLKTKAHADRALVLWMLRPKTNPREAADEIYSCPEETRGSHYSGPTRISLVDASARRVINTVSIRQEYDEGVEDSFDIPYKIHKGYYHVGGVRRGSAEGKPSIMWLRDYNGDGRAHEFALFDALACMGLATTLIGYSESRDEVIQYPVVLSREEGGKRSTKTVHWIDYLFSRQPDAPGLWKYEIDYRGRGGSLDSYEIRYDRAGERFEGKLVVRWDE